jgi:hypothetical protein
MSRLVVFLLVAGALLVGTNPSRAEFNAWAQTWVVRKIDEEARKRGENPDEGASQIGGAIAGLVISHMPIERRNFLAFSVYNLKIPDDSDRDRSCNVLGIAGQFVPLGSC